LLRGRIFGDHSYRLQLFPAGVEFGELFLRGGEVGGELVGLRRFRLLFQMAGQMAHCARNLCWPLRKTVAIWRLKWKLIETMSAKDILLEVAEKLPPEATLNDAIYELEFRQSVQQGLDELDRGEGIPIEQVKAKIAAWAGK